MNYEVEQNSYGLETIHKSLLKALIEFDKICRNNNISYALYGGTMLGAERNKKFIPWDDDADICMTRNQYEKLCNVISNNNKRLRNIYQTRLQCRQNLCMKSDI